MRAAVFLDRDGTLIDELGFLARPEDLHLYPWAGPAVRRLNEAGFAVVVVTNQSGIARGLFGERELSAIHARLAAELARHGAHLDDVLHCPHHPREGTPPLRSTCACRKPAPGLVLEAARRHELDLSRSYLIGDSLRDLECGARAGLHGTLLVRTGKGADELARWPASTPPPRVADDLLAAVEALLAQEAQGR